MLGLTTGIADRIFGGPNPKTIASASLESMRAQNRLIAFVARYVSVVSSEQQRLGGLVSSERTLDPARRRALRARPVQAPAERRDAGTRRPTRSRVQLPEVEIAGPDVDLDCGAGIWRRRRAVGADQCQPAARPGEPRRGPSPTCASRRTAAVPMRLARQAARQAVERSFAMPLLAAGFKDVKVVARFPTDGTDDA